ncbi:chlorite dismutase family protein [Phycisphaera mikurensis]|uniref:chlorite dismutase family protein n=1 Tax=Phycisphaera mikurensis TaxID=547188 RepID=UPI0012B5215B|nr:chlorite dismutase family protein [Phycisphaera mikurensis]MBB6441074.1 chlorite dismutase [Phycisphaera mikurensis]
MPELDEVGGGGARSARRLFVQLLVFTGAADTAPLAASLAEAGHEAVLYADVNDPRGVGLLTCSEDPGFFPTTLRALLASPPWSSLTPRPAFTMFGRTYAIGYERDLDDTLLHKPRRHAWQPAWPWAIWYPLRRAGAFAALPEAEQRAMLKEHGELGMGFAQDDAAHDVRLACHGLDAADSDFVIGLMGPDLSPLSKLVQAMRKTKQTSLYLERLGPFFVGHAVSMVGGVAAPGERAREQQIV